MVKRILSQIPNTSNKQDDLANLIGQFGKWQLILFASISLVKLSSGWVQMAILFLTPNFKFWCDDFGPNSTVVAENSTCYGDCLSYAYDTTPFNNTIISEWDLVCERAWLASLTQMVLQLGVLIGSVMFGFLSDRYGRKKTFLFSVVALIALGFAVPFSPDYLTFTIIRFFLGVALSGTMVVSFVIIMESSGKDYREILGCLYHMSFNVGHVLLPVFAYYFRSWDDYTLALAVPPLIYLSYFFVLTESPRWLVSVGRVDEASKIVKKAAEMNGLPTTKIEDTLKQMSEEIRLKSNEVKPHYGHLFQKSLITKTLSCSYMWMITGLTFFGFNQYISQTSEDPFVIVGAAGAIQIPSNLMSIWLIRRFGRKATTSTFFTIGGLCIVVLAIIPDHLFWATLTFGSLGVFCSSIVANCIYIYTSELFPTVIRNMGMGACSTCMRVGSMAAPFISNLSLTVPWLPTVVFGLAPISAGLVCLVLPETKGTALPDSLEDVNNAKS